MIHHVPINRTAPRDDWTRASGLETLAMHKRPEAAAQRFDQTKQLLIVHCCKNDAAAVEAGLQAVIAAKAHIQLHCSAQQEKR